MPFLQLFTTLPSQRVPKDFIQKTAVLLTQILKNKPLERISIHLMTDQSLFNGSDPNGKEDNAYAVLRSIGCVAPEDNRKTVEALSKHVSRELGISDTQFKIFFIDLDPSMCGTKGKILSDK